MNTHFLQRMMAIIKKCTVLLSMTVICNGCITNERITYEQALGRSEAIDAATNDEDDEEISAVLDALDCNMKLDGLSVVYELNSKGVIKDVWANKNDEAASCVSSGLNGKSLYIPSVQPYYAEIIFKEPPILASGHIDFEKNKTCNPTIEGSGTLVEAGNMLKLINARIKLSNNPSYNEETVEIKRLSLSMQSYYYHDGSKNEDECIDETDKTGSWGCRYYGDPIVINKNLTLGEELEIKDIELVMDISKTRIDREKWNAVSISVTSDKRIASTGSKIGYLTNQESDSK